MSKNVKKCQKMSKILISDGLVLILDGEMTFPGERKNCVNLIISPRTNGFLKFFEGKFARPSLGSASTLDREKSTKSIDGFCCHGNDLCQEVASCRATKLHPGSLS